MYENGTVEAEMVSRSNAPSSGGSLPSVRHLTHHSYTTLPPVYYWQKKNARKIIPAILPGVIDYIPQYDV